MSIDRKLMTLKAIRNTLSATTDDTNCGFDHEKRPAGVQCPEKVRHNRLGCPHTGDVICNAIKALIAVNIFDVNKGKKHVTKASELMNELTRLDDIMSGHLPWEEGIEEKQKNLIKQRIKLRKAILSICDNASAI